MLTKRLSLIGGSRFCLSHMRRNWLSTSAIADIEATNKVGEGQWRIMDTGNKGYGVFAQRDYSKHEVVLKSKAARKGVARDSHSVQIGWGDQVHLNLPGHLLNHSCDANVGVRENELGAYDFVSVKPIRAGEEVLLDYGTFEFEPISFEICKCGSPICRGKNISFKTSPETIDKQYGEYCAKYLRDWKPGAYLEMFASR